MLYEPEILRVEGIEKQAENESAGGTKWMSMADRSKQSPIIV